MQRKRSDQRRDGRLSPARTRAEAELDEMRRELWFRSMMTGGLRQNQSYAHTTRQRSQRP